MSTNTDQHDASTSNLLVLPGRGDASGTHLVVKVHADTLGKDFSVMEGIMKPRSLLAPHKHANEDQVVIVLNGELEFEVGGEGGTRFVAPAGSYVVKPRGSFHTFWNKGAEDVRYIELSGGAGFQGFIDRSTEVGAQQAAQESVEDYDMQWDYARIPKLMLEHQLIRISGIEAPWDTLAELSPGDMMSKLKEGLSKLAS